MKDRRFVLLFLLLLFSIVLLEGAYSQSTKSNGKVKDKDKDKKETKVNNEEKSEKNDKVEKIKSDFVYSEILEKEIGKSIDKKDINNYGSINIDDKKYIEKQDKMTNCLRSLEDLQSKIDNIKKDTKIISLDNVDKIKEQYNLFDNIRNSFELQNSQLLNSLNDQEKELVKSQSDRIEKSRKDLDGLLYNFNKDLDKKKTNNKELFENAKEIEDEIRVIYRQLRAIEWILSS